MVHEDFFEKTLIEFVEFSQGKERLVAKYKKFTQIPIALQIYSKNKLYPLVTLKGKKWKISGISRNLRAHGPGIHMKIKVKKI
jgi:hypothetical protein